MSRSQIHPIFNSSYAAAIAEVFRLEGTTEIYQLIIFASDHQRMSLSFNIREQT